MSTRISVGALALSATLSCSYAHAALTVEQMGANVTAQTLVNSLLAANSGLQISNVQYVGHQAQAGAFAGGSSARLGLNAGAVLSTGAASNLSLVAGSDVPSDTFGKPGDALLTALVHARTVDAVGLRFDFVPTGNRIQLSYVFGSSEYNFWVDRVYNDTFAAFVNGKNAALIPGTSDPLQVHTLNCGPAETINGPAGGSGPNCGQFIDNWNVGGVVGKNVDINLGGFSQTFSLSASVNPNVTNSMYLVLADVADGSHDSAVFLGAGSLAAVPEPRTVQFLGAAAAMLLVGWRRRAMR